MNDIELDKKSLHEWLANKWGRKKTIQMLKPNGDAGYWLYFQLNEPIQIFFLNWIKNNAIFSTQTR